jgi:hypothetical protein
MADRNVTPKDSAISPTAYGRKLAVGMLIEFRAMDHNDETCIEPRYRPGKPQSDILTRYVRAVRDQYSPAVEAGFFAVLTDYLAHEAATEPEYYNDLYENGNARRGFTIVPKGSATTPQRHAVAKAGDLTNCRA